MPCGSRVDSDRVDKLGRAGFWHGRMVTADKACYRAIRSSCQMYRRFADAREGDLEKKTFHSVTASVMSRKMKQLLALTGTVKVFFFLRFSLKICFMNKGM